MRSQRSLVATDASTFYALRCMASMASVRPPSRTSSESPSSGSGRPVIRSSVDGFHNPRELRYRRGRGSPEGFYLDSHDYAALRIHLLDPLGPGGSSAIFDHVSDSRAPLQMRAASPGVALILDGLFLHRQELREHLGFFHIPRRAV
jgi:hypothetical protein